VRRLAWCRHAGVGEVFEGANGGEKGVEIEAAGRK
jgi:hypothetical protein